MYTRLEVFLWKEMMGVSITGHAATTTAREDELITFAKLNSIAELLFSTHASLIALARTPGPQK